MSCKRTVATTQRTCRQCRSLCKACWWETWSPGHWDIYNRFRWRWRPQSLRTTPSRCTKIQSVIKLSWAWVLWFSYLSPQVLQEPHGTRAILLRRGLFEEFPLRNQLFYHVLGVLGRHGSFWKQKHFLWKCFRPAIRWAVVTMLFMEVQSPCSSIKLSNSSFLI